MIEYKKYTITLKDGITGAKKRSVKRQKSQDDTWYYLGLVGQIGYVVALPIAGGAIVGSLAGKTLIGIVLGIVLSVLGFMQIIHRILQKRE